MRSEMEVIAAGAKWSCRVVSRLRDAQTAELEFIFQVLDGAAASAVVGVAFDFHAWLETNYVFMPAAVYQGNDFAVAPDALSADLEG